MADSKGEQDVLIGLSWLLVGARAAPTAVNADVGILKPLDDPRRY
jgi:hypothetical protein